MDEKDSHLEESFQLKSQFVLVNNLIAFRSKESYLACLRVIPQSNPESHQIFLKFPKFEKKKMNRELDNNLSYLKRGHNCTM